jgi:phosphoenolpyruvate-protein phosphotransferase (PTS system enzyme I)
MPQEQANIILGSYGSGGCAIGTIFIPGQSYNGSEPSPSTSANPQTESERFKIARQDAANSLQMVVDAARKMTGRDVVDIIQTQQEILNDPELHHAILQHIEESHILAEQAIDLVFKHYIRSIEETGSAYMMERTADLRDIRDRLFRHLNVDQIPAMTHGNILFNYEITPTELLEYAPFISAAAMVKGGPTSHVVIIAKSIGLPIIVGARELMKYATSGLSVAIDADHARIHIEPDDNTCAIIRSRIQKDHDQMLPDPEDLMPTNTRCGVPIKVSANIEFGSDLEFIEQYRPEGIGLVRTESMLMSMTTDHSVARQQEFYLSVVEASLPHEVTFRLLDIGGDKLNEREVYETNPHLGWRGARLLLDRPTLLDAQLEALLRVSATYPGMIRIMLPMLTVIEEWYRFKKHLERVHHRLRKLGIPFDPNIKLGMMIEVPSAALMAHHLAQEADFFSIGTNDLTQYVMAVDRGNPMVSALYDTLHPAVLETIRMASEAARQHNIPISICGESASDPVSAACFIGLGVRELSMNPRAIPSIRKMIRSSGIEELSVFANQLLLAHTAEERKAVLEERLKAEG